MSLIVTLIDFYKNGHFLKYFFFTLIILLNPYFAFLYPIYKLSYSDLKTGEIVLFDIIHFLVVALLLLDLNINIYNFYIVIAFLIFSALELMGFGDVLLFLIIALFFDTYSFILVIFISSITSLMYSLLLKKTTIPYGPFILLAFLLLLLL